MVAARRPDWWSELLPRGPHWPACSGRGAVGAGGPLQFQMRVSVPTLVIWGEQDRALVSSNLTGLEAFVPRLTVKRIPDATHWIVHERSAEVSSLIRDFIR